MRLLEHEAGQYTNVINTKIASYRGTVMHSFTEYSFLSESYIYLG